ncbi:methylated-DNA--[protein]-cysteine S-methyltransferase [Miltoncostaea oceani]|uniref:methylated-DNA--[protein]-cysteine S-methyltransferase n=1 Tax=Miltoncostaea oceani TaxID=2843216 RepID=UPI001C3E614D|nr:methylated-DNA--[protein]-cysteine S-methyltransferase [Miltoncostaea oceani]
MTTRPAWTTVGTSLGPVTLVAGPAGLRSVRWDGPGATAGLDDRDRDPAALARAAGQLTEYLDGARRAFDLPLDLRGTALELRVWEALRAIPHGATVTYAQLARDVGRPAAVRAVAGAVARTPVPVVVPCHRVIGADGGLRGYVGGLARKAALLRLEGADVPAARAPQPAAG